MSPLDRAIGLKFVFFAPGAHFSGAQCTPHLSPLALAAFPKLKSLGGFHPTMVGRVCVVIGAGPGLGISCAKRWVREGFKVPNMFVEPFLPYDFLEDNFIARLL